MVFWHWRRSTKALCNFSFLPCIAIWIWKSSFSLWMALFIGAMDPFAIVTRRAEICQCTIKIEWKRAYYITDNFLVVISTLHMPKTQILSTCCVGLSSYIVSLSRWELNNYWFAWVFLLNLYCFSPQISFKSQVNYTDIWLTAYRILLGYTEQSRKGRWGFN